MSLLEKKAVGMLETIGFASALIAADACLKAAEVKIVGMERNIGVKRIMSVTVLLEGEVAAVQSAVDAGKSAVEDNGTLVSSNVIANLDMSVKRLLKK